MESRNTIRTFSGQYVNLESPNPPTVRIEDIAHALSHTNMFFGHYPRPFSKAEYSLALLDKLKKKYPTAHPNLYLHGFLLNAHEAYLPEVPLALVKSVDKNYLGYQQVFVDIIFEKNKIDESEYMEKVDAVDKELRSTFFDIWRNGENIGNKSLKPDYVEKEYKNKYYELIRTRETWKE